MKKTMAVMLTMSLYFLVQSAFASEFRFYPNGSMFPYDPYGDGYTYCVGIINDSDQECTIDHTTLAPNKSIEFTFNFSSPHNRSRKTVTIKIAQITRQVEIKPDFGCDRVYKKVTELLPEIRKIS